MKNGWFLGNFEPTVLRTTACEAAVKTYQKGEKEASHYHRIATEITVIVDGRVKMFQREFSAGDIIVVEPGDATEFEALENTVNVVVKIPGANNDKYLTESDIFI